MENNNSRNSLSSDTPLTFDHPEKLSEGITLEDTDLFARSYISEDGGQIKFNIVVKNKTTGKENKRDVVIGSIEENED